MRNLWYGTINKCIFVAPLFFLLTSCLVQHDTIDGNTVIQTSNNINKEVGYIFAEQARQMAKSNLCLKPDDYNIKIIDILSSPGRIPRYKKTVVLPWLFDKNNKRDKDIHYSNEDRITYYTRQYSINRAIPHEIGHLLFAKFIMKNKISKGGYGSIAPDWLDEGAAIIFENDEMTQTRRVFFHDSFRLGKTHQLEDFLQMENLTSYSLSHKPNFVWQDGEVAKNSGERLANKEQELITPHNTNFNSDLFYGQSRVFADYLIERTGKSCILSEIGAYIVKRKSFEKWLKQQAYIPQVTTIDALEEDFKLWAQTQSNKYPPLESWVRDISTQQ